MKHEQFCEPLNGKMVRQYPKGIDFAYDLYLGHSRDNWKGLNKENNRENRINDIFLYGASLM